MIPLTCDHCDKKLRLRDELAGRRIKCPGCGGTLTVPLGDDKVEDVPAPKKKAATFTPVKPTRARHDDDDEDPDDGERGRQKKNRADVADKPSSAFLILGLILGLGGLVAMSAFIVFAKQANDKSSEKQHALGGLRANYDQSVNELHKKVLAADIEKAEIEIEDIQREEVMRYSLFAVLAGIVFIIGFGIRGYYHIAIKRWHAETHGSGKKRKRPEDDDDDEN